ncbi:MAG: chorismate synthase [Flammeovirgaceae bacterium]|nr:chorismate synthase [Flammeovirgaceae bacterium]MBE63128.1 chorismate synthase [Flammeovirgaceae bacterium]MBR08417.1 chorismate synthase [Rickettsiales bacterium]HCX22035.1 chorismate synthase [Cytophagales bacterium]|tara:strand:+ start:28 stop:1110 length:1083 start_codon:yes stop_codon:yes gene_type:complete
MGNIFGKIFSITTFGESHGAAIGVTINGCPAGIPIDMEFIQNELARRKPGQSKIVTQRKEEDQVEILSGVFDDMTTGTPIGMVIRNKDQKSKDYGHIAEKFRPSHADYTYETKYGIRDYRGGGRSSARETAARVAAGAIAKLMLKKFGISFHAYVSQVGDLSLNKHYTELDLSQTELNDVRCPDQEIAQKMYDYIDQVRKDRDTVGGVVTGVIKGVPTGLGEPAFDKLHAELGKAMLSINAVKGFEYGSGFEGVKMRGSEHNDAFYVEDGVVKTKTNYSGGIQGGISNGQDIYFNVAFKPVATIMQDQESIDKHGKEAVVSGKGRHDPCVVPRAVPIVEAMAALVIADFLLIARTNKLEV